MMYEDAPKPEDIYKPKPDFEKIASFLYDLLDDIDTLDDALKNNDSLFRESVRRIQQRRFEVADPDSQSINWRTDTQHITASSPGTIFISEKLKKIKENNLFGGTDGESDPRRKE